MEIQEIDISRIRPYPDNPRKISDEAVEKVANSIREFGFQQPLVVDSDYVIIVGHTRLKAAEKLGLRTVPAVVADNLTPEQAKAYRLADNKTGELSDWDEEKLIEELEDLFNLDFSMEQFGFEDYYEDEEEEDGAKESGESNWDNYVPKDTDIKFGDRYRLGNHVLMCGDSTAAEDVTRLMDGAVADLCIADPPYGMGKEADGVLGDNTYKDDLLAFNNRWIPLSFGALKDNGSWYCWGIDEPLMDIYAFILRPMIKSQRITFRNLITWDKGRGQGQNSEGGRMYARADEKCLFVMCGVQGFNTNSDNYFEKWEPVRLYLRGEADKVGLTAAKLKEICGVGMYSHWFTKSQWELITPEHYRKLQEAYPDAFRKEYDEIRKEYDEIRKEYYSTRAYFDNTHDNMNDVWHFEPVRGYEKEQEGIDHSTPKPVALVSRAVMSSSRAGDTVLDPFGGSGTTLIACEHLGRKCRMMELSPEYCQLIIDRWEALTGMKAERIAE